jgi:hypothetical protein
MATRPVFCPRTGGRSLVDCRFIEFVWHPGFASTQKQKSIDSLHAAAQDAGIKPLLEVSTKSSDETGRRLSAFNLTVESESAGPISLESAFQGSKVFEAGGPFADLYGKSGREVKRDERLRSSGGLLRFDFEGEGWLLEPKTAFYDWLYLNAVHARPELATALAKYAGFTDVEFNPVKAINCQAFSCALYVALAQRDLIDEALSDRTSFLEILDYDSWTSTGSADTGQVSAGI